MAKKKPKIMVPGIFHDLEVRLVTQTWLARYLKDKNVLAAYIQDEELIYISKNVPSHIRKHNFYHEMAHHIQDTLVNVEGDEARCDLLGSLLIRIQEQKERIEGDICPEET